MNALGIHYYKIQKYVLYTALIATITLLALVFIGNMAVGEAGIGLNYYMNTHGATPSEGLVAGGITLYSSYVMGLAWGGPVGVAVGL
ncbi:hypothetical protein [Mesobacillus maritimus]|uniref:ABC transporter permease n=1 Tax=Mesobacillus maritimus TaxID=1643336 RepID=A0ABS7K4T3_9BACI|nr:hypothetical protein [Mesobacillus maritimus]MBY0097273.1 hypothetical protein [Mesobacillus maritimus]